MARFLPLLVAALLGSLIVAPAQAEVKDATAGGFYVSNNADLPLDPMEVWELLRRPSAWWSAEHSWTGDAENFWLDAQAGGCFCEKFPGDAKTRGSVRHADVQFAKPGEMLRMTGALGPLQGEALVGTLSIAIVPTTTGSRVQFDYVVGGYSRIDLVDIAPAVDAVIAEQLRGLKAAAMAQAGPLKSDDSKASVDDDVQADADDTGNTPE